jgi:polysaccharide deacetylase 2 family uncharacterized protein YibQ
MPAAMPGVLAGLLGMALLAFLGWVLVVNDPLGGEPAAIVRADSHTQGKPTSPDGAALGAAIEAHNDGAAEKVSPSRRDTVTIIDGMSGKRQEVAIGADASSGAKQGLSPEKMTPPTAPETRTPIDARMLEATPHGPIPKIPADGARPADVYARPAGPPAAKPGPRIAIVVEGLGTSAATTSEAMAKLIGPVTLAFSPYATDVGRWVDRARGEGHEVLLQVPMEPLDYPDNDPGPRTLLTSVGADQNLDRLHWFMSRFQGYVGVSNYMGARFTGTEAAAAPVMSDVARRGLIYFDDGSSPRSLAGQLSGSNNGAFARADVTIDAVPTGTEIDNALARLETMARERGLSVGVASALPVTVERISQWAKTAEGRGLTLVPVSAVASKPKSS